MKQICTSFRLAFSMYSVFPARQVEKTRENMKYILIFVPLIGAIIGFLIKEWQVISPYLVDKDLLGAVFCAIMPIFLSGGAFLDGFFRTVDALGSHQPRAGKLEILKDSRDLRLLFFRDREPLERDAAGQLAGAGVWLYPFEGAVRAFNRLLPPYPEEQMLPVCE